MEPTIRRAREQDAAELGRLLGELGYSTTPEEVMSRWPLLQDDRSLLLVAEGASHLAGFLAFARMPLVHADGWLGRVLALVVDARERRRGLGKQLLRAMEAEAWAQGCLRVEITTGDWRIDAHRFYEQAGYAPDERRFIKRRPA